MTSGADDDALPGRETSASPAPGTAPAPYRTAVAAAVAAVAAAIGLLAGCGGASAPSGDGGVTLRLVIPDAHIREPDAPCSGGRGFQFAHAQARYSVQDAAGAEVASGALPEGRAEKAFTVDLGVTRQPTVCVMMVDVPGVDTLDGHSLVIDDRSPAPITPNPNLAGIPEVVLR